MSPLDQEPWGRPAVEPACAGYGTDAAASPASGGWRGALAPGVPREAKRAVAVAVLGSLALAALALVVSLVIMSEFRALGFFHLNDVLFDSDTRSRVAVFSVGELVIAVMPFGLPGSIHPYLSLYVTPVIATAAKLIHLISPDTASELELRVALAAFVSPLVLALQSFLLGLLLFMLGLPLRHVALIAIFYVVAFSNLVFGAIPEHYPLASLSITLMLILAVSAVRFPSLDRLWIWVPLGLFATGLTISNVAFVAIAHLLSGLFSRTEPPLKRLAKSGLFAFSVFAFVLTTEQVLIRAVNGQPNPGALGEDFVSRFMRPDEAPLLRLERAAAAVGNAVAPAPSGIRELDPPRPPGPISPTLPSPFRERSPYPRLTLEAEPHGSPATSILGLVALAGMGVGAALMIRRGGACRVVATISLAILAFNLILHAFWGREFFLYSQHWIAASVLLFSGILSGPPRLQGLLAATVALYVGTVAANNATVMWHIFSVARAAAGG